MAARENNNKAEDDVLRAIRQLPCWSAVSEIVPLTGGITNRNYRVTDGGGERYVVRLGRDIPAHGVMRFNELAAAKAAFAAGISPEVIYAGDGVLVSRFIAGETFTPELVREPRNLPRIVDLVKRCHQDIPRHFQGPALIFWAFQVVRSYLALLEANRSNPYDIGLDVLAGYCDRLEQALGPVTIVFGHNDLLAANIMDDGRRLWLIDWDYAGFNSPLFDLANLASNNELTAGMEALVLDRYFGPAEAAAQRRGFLAMKCASLLRETLWGAASRITSSLDFDYTAYARDYLARFDRMWKDFEKSHG
ncbi:MAG TPA: choline/ethanolamine kinase family protein [Steroidobacteraceae bacterium]|nr:choline/ethanolamine kinase family protein [Steroidobacteraceae bacterium]